jgi:hypothetical protein
MSEPYNIALGNLGNANIQAYYDLINNNHELQNMTQIQLENKNNELIKKSQIELNQLKEIQEKEKILLTKSRMLQISIERNSYKKKIIYTIIAFIFGIFILTLFIYSHLFKK